MRAILIFLGDVTGDADNLIIAVGPCAMPIDHLETVGVHFDQVRFRRRRAAAISNGMLHTTPATTPNNAGRMPLNQAIKALTVATMTRPRIVFRSTDEYPSACKRVVICGS